MHVWGPDLATNILNLPLIDATIVTGNNEDWLDAFAYLDGAGAPISLDGISFTSVVRHLTEDPAAVIVASTLAGPVLGGLKQNGRLAVGGTGGNVVAFNVPASTMRRLPPRDYVFDMTGTADGITRRLATGKVTITEGVTR